MKRRKRSQPPPYLGDPNGAHWSAIRPPGVPDDDELDFTVRGDRIRFMWDFGVVIPLWVEGGAVPREKEWSRRALGLSSALIDDLAAWGNAMEHLDGNPRMRTDEAYADLDRRARELVGRIRDEVGERFTVTYQPR